MQTLHFRDRIFSQIRKDRGISWARKFPVSQYVELFFSGSLKWIKNLQFRNFLKMTWMTSITFTINHHKKKIQSTGVPVPM